MCNAWNHRANCNCGWGGNGRGSGGNGCYNLSNNFLSRKAQTLVKIIKNTNEAKTYPRLCWWCGASVYYHTNGNGDSVLFDSLGYPWEVHSCWTEYWSKEKERNGNISKSLKLPSFVLKPMIFEESLQSYEPKYLVLAGAINSLREDNITVTYEAVAEKLGLTLEQLYHDYGEFYEIYLENQRRMLRLVDIRNVRF